MLKQLCHASLLAISCCVLGCALSSTESPTLQEETSQAISTSCQYPHSVTDCESCNGNNTCHVCCGKLATGDQPLCNANCDDIWPPPKPRSPATFGAKSISAAVE